MEKATCVKWLQNVEFLKEPCKSTHEARHFGDPTPPHGPGKSKSKWDPPVLLGPKGKPEMPSKHHLGWFGLLLGCLGAPFHLVHKELGSNIGPISQQQAILPWFAPQPSGVPNKGKPLFLRLIAKKEEGKEKNCTPRHGEGRKKKQKKKRLTAQGVRLSFGKASWHSRTVSASARGAEGEAPWVKSRCPADGTQSNHQKT